jgi:hypothetical protein
VSEQETEPYWASAAVPQRHDIALLRSGTKRGERFETVQDASSYSELLQSSLRRAPGGYYCAEVLRDCRSGYYLCSKPFCPLCARRYRRWLFWQITRLLAQPNTPTTIVTTYFEERDLGDLCHVHVGRLKDQLRNQMNRSGLETVIAVGGIEAAHKQGRWLLHGHVAISGADQRDLKNLRELYKAKGVERAFLAQKLKDPVRQLSYLLKFHSFSRPTKSGRAYPLKPAAACELARWQNDHEFGDFLFLKGLRRQGEHLRIRENRG